MYKVYLVDDEEIVLKIISFNRLEQVGFEICGYQTNPTMIIDELIELQPDIVILDIHMMRLNGLELARQIYNLKMISSFIFSVLMINLIMLNKQ